LAVTPHGFQLQEYAPGWTPEEIQEPTEARLSLADDLREFRRRD
jgi:acyl CoA:acetate/3-ketoacid CoA transferase beta subunit